MALKEMKAICDQIRAKWNVIHIALVHKYVFLKIYSGEIIYQTINEHLKSNNLYAFTINY
jgi:molybdopterin synthase catalytic subunit